MSTLAMPRTRMLGTDVYTQNGAVSDGLSPVLLRVAVSVLAVLATYALGSFVLHRFDKPVRELAITGALRNVQPGEVRAAITPLLESSKLFALDLDVLRVAIEQLPWVAHVRIDRQWPARLAVRITEREPFARWGDGDALSTEGIVFAPGSAALSPTLPKLGGEPARAMEVMTMYGQLADRLSETPFALTGLTLDARGEWTGTTESDVTLRFGRSNPVAQIARLKNTVLPALMTRLDAVQRIDLRYANGFAVGWRDTTETRHRLNPGEPNSSIEISTPAATRTGVAPGATP